MTIHFGGKHRGHVHAGSRAPCGKPLFTQRSNEPGYDFDAAPFTADRAEVTCTECLAVLEHDDRLHWCEIVSAAFGSYGAAATECYEDDDGRFWITNGEYANTVRFCPHCGVQAPNPAKETKP